MKREREDAPYNVMTQTYIFPSLDVKKPHVSFAPPPPPPPLPCIVSQTALALVQNPQRLEAYVFQMPSEYLLGLLDVIASGVLNSPMAVLLKDHNQFWYLVLKRFTSEGYDQRVPYKEIAMRAYGMK